MTEIERKALALVNEVHTDFGLGQGSTFNRKWGGLHEALCRALEQHEAYKQEVSDAVEKAVADCGHDELRKAYVHSRFFHFIISKPDPLVEAWIEATGNTVGMEPLNEAIAKRGGKIVWGEG